MGKPGRPNEPPDERAPKKSGHGQRAARNAQQAARREALLARLRENTARRRAEKASQESEAQPQDGEPPGAHGRGSEAEDLEDTKGQPSIGDVGRSLSSGRASAVYYARAGVLVACA